MGVCRCLAEGACARQRLGGPAHGCNAGTTEPSRSSRNHRVRPSVRDIRGRRIAQAGLVSQRNRLGRPLAHARRPRSRPRHRAQRRRGNGVRGEGRSSRRPQRCPRPARAARHPWRRVQCGLRAEHGRGDVPARRPDHRRPGRPPVERLIALMYQSSASGSTAVSPS